MKPLKIALVGSFDVENYGDLLFVSVFEAQIKKILPVEELILFAPKHCKMPFDTEREVYSVTEMDEVFGRTAFDAIVIGGGDLIHLLKIDTIMPSISNELVCYEALFMWTLPVFTAVKYGLPIVFNAPGVPHAFLETDNPLVSTLVETIDYISVRDELSKQNLVDIGVRKKITVVPDSVLSISELYTQAELEQTIVHMDSQFLFQKPFIFAQINQAFTKEDVMEFGRVLIELKAQYGWEVVLQPIGYALNDLKNIDLLLQAYPCAFQVQENKICPKELMAMINRSKLYIGSSLHGFITANAMKTPAVVFNYTKFNKIDGYCEMTGQSDLVVYKNEEIIEAAACALSHTPLQINPLLEKIHTHFKQIADVIQRPPQETRHMDSLAVSAIESFYRNRQMTLQWNHTIQALRDELQHYKNLLDIEKNKEQTTIAHFMMEKEVLEQRLNECQMAMQASIHEYENSTSWKLTKPLRNCGKIIKKK